MGVAAIQIAKVIGAQPVFGTASSADKLERARELGLELFRSYEQVVESVAATGRLRRDPATTAQALWAGAHGVVSLMITKPYFEWVAPETLVDTLLDGLFAGLLKP